MIDYERGLYIRIEELRGGSPALTPKKRFLVGSRLPGVGPLQPVGVRGVLRNIARVAEGLGVTPAKLFVDAERFEKIGELPRPPQACSTLHRMLNPASGAAL